MSTKGCDYAFPPHPPVSALVAVKMSFVCRYHGGSRSKDLTRPEADALHAAGIATVSNWESSTGAARGGRGQGAADAGEAARQHAEDGGPLGRPIYFSVDWDVQPSELAVVGEYFKGVVGVIGLARVGAYGGYRVIKYLLDHGLIAWAWQTYAWSGGQWDPRTHIRQVQNGVFIGGADCDLDQGMVDDIGQWPHDAQMAEVAMSTDDFIDSFRQGLTHAADGKAMAPVDWQLKREAREKAADAVQARILATLQDLAGKTPTVDVGAIAAAVVSGLPPTATVDVQALAGPLAAALAEHLPSHITLTGDLS